MIAAPLGPVQNVSVDIGSGFAFVRIRDPVVNTGPFTFDYQMYIASMPVQFIREVNDVNSPFNVTGLQGNVEYIIRVSAYCICFATKLFVIHNYCKFKHFFCLFFSTTTD